VEESFSALLDEKANSIFPAPGNSSAIVIWRFLLTILLSSFTGGAGMRLMEG
jgi:hypothetical protein